MSGNITRDQFYLFTMPGQCTPEVWAEIFGADGLHTVAPTPYFEIERAAAFLRERHPGAIVDELCFERDIAECRTWARTMPLENLPV